MEVTEGESFKRGSPQRFHAARKSKKVKNRISLRLEQFQGCLKTTEAASGEEREGGSDGKRLKHEWVLRTWKQ